MSKVRLASTITIQNHESNDTDEYDNVDNNEVHVSLLDYPVCCIKLSSMSTKNLGEVLGEIMEIVQEYQAQFYL